MKTIEELYGPVDILSGFISPEFQRGFEFFSNKKLLKYAEVMARAIRKSNRQQVLVSETAARPLAYVVEKLLQKSSVHVDWQYMKFPREPRENIFPLLNYYLSDPERKEVGSALEKACESVPSPSLYNKNKSLQKIFKEIGIREQDQWKKQISNIFENTEISKKLSQPFIYFDEYIDSGTTLQNAQMYYSYFTRNPDFLTMSYYTAIENSVDNDRILLSLYDKDSRRECFENGSYPFENRLDLIGYCYYYDNQRYCKVTLEEVQGQFGNSECNPTQLLERIDRVVEENSLLESYKQNFSIPAVRNYMEKPHLMRQFMVSLEKEAYGKGPYSEYLWQLADMYGPAWTPMPKENHLDFFNGTKKSWEQIKSAKGFEEVKELYHKTRPAIMYQSASVCLERKNNWESEIKNLMEVKK